MRLGSSDMLIIGCGNRQRGDDAAGILVAEQLASRGIPTETCSGEASELMELWADAEEVIVIDAVVTGAAVGTVHVWDSRSPLPHCKVSGSTHGFGVAEAVELSRALGTLPGRLRIYGIEGKRFEIGGKLSPEVKRAIEEVASRHFPTFSTPISQVNE